MNYIIGLDQYGTSFIFVQTTGQAGTYRSVTAPSVAPLHTWTHAAAVLDSGTMKLYINGRLVGSQPSPGPPAGGAVPFALGGAIPDGQNLCCGFNGALRQARVWSRALSAPEVQTYAGQTLTGAELGLLADWPLDDGAGSPRDVGPQLLSLSAVGSALWESTPLYDGGPYWDYNTIQSAIPGYGTDTVIDLDGNGLTALTANQHDVAIAGPLRAFRWEQKEFVDATSIVFPAPGINILSPDDWVVADFNGDGRLDVFLASSGIDLNPYVGGQSFMFIQSAAGPLVDETSSRLPAISNFTHTAAAADVDGDGDIDLYVGNICCGTTGPQLYINDGSGHFTSRTTGLPDFVVSRQQVFTSARFIDVNNDGFPDLVLGSDSSSGSNVLLLNDGHGNFNDAPNILPAKAGGVGWITVAISAGDFDGDGYTDLILAMTDNYQGHSKLQLLLNNRDGTFRDASSQIPQNWPTIPSSVGQSNGSWIQKIVPCDINGDGWTDFVTAGGANLSPRLFINEGNGNFVDVTATLPDGWFDNQVLAGDFDGDGRVDLFFDHGGGNYGFARNLKPILPAKTPGPGLSKPIFTAESITNAASFQSGSIAPGEIVTIFGSNLGPRNLTTFYMTDPTDISKSISGARVLFNGVPAPMIYTSAGQLSVVVPYSVASNPTATVQVEYNLVKSDPIKVSVVPTAPGLFVQDASGAGAILNQDYTINSRSNPATAGFVVFIYGTGGGTLQNSTADGTLAPSASLLQASVSVLVGGQSAQVLYAGAAPGLVNGLTQINVQLPAGVTGGAVPVVATIGQKVSQSVTVAIR